MPASTRYVTVVTPQYYRSSSYFGLWTQTKKYVWIEVSVPPPTEKPVSYIVKLIQVSNGAFWKMCKHFEKVWKIQKIGTWKIKFTQYYTTILHTSLSTPIVIFDSIWCIWRKKISEKFVESFAGKAVTKAHIRFLFVCFCVSSAMFRSC